MDASKQLEAVQHETIVKNGFFEFAEGSPNDLLTPAERAGDVAAPAPGPTPLNRSQTAPPKVDMTLVRETTVGDGLPEEGFEPASDDDDEQTSVADDFRPADDFADAAPPPPGAPPVVPGELLRMKTHNTDHYDNPPQPAYKRELPGNWDWAANASSSSGAPPPYMAQPVPMPMPVTPSQMMPGQMLVMAPMGGPMGGPMSGPMGGVVYAGPDGQPMQQFVPAQDKTLPPAPAGPSGALAPGAGAPRAQPQPQTLHTSVHSENQRIKWTVDARKLRGGDKQAVSQAFPISWGGLQVNFKVMIYPKMMHDQRGGSSFKKAKGKGTITLKCEAELPQGTPPLKFRFAIAQGLNAHKSEDPDQDDLVGLQDYRGPVRHNFADGAMCGLPKDLEEWDFNAVVDHDSQTFLVCLEVVGESS